MCTIFLIFLSLATIDADIATWEQVLHAIEEKRWGEKIVIKRDIIEEREHVKILEILNESKFKIYSDVIRDIIT